MIFDMTVLRYCKKFEQQILANYWNIILQFLLLLKVSHKFGKPLKFLAEKYLFRSFLA